MKILNILKEVKDNRKSQGKQYPLSAILSVIVLSRLCGYEDIKSAWYLCCDLHYKQKHQLGFRKYYQPSYPVFTESLRCCDIDSLELVLSKLSSCLDYQEDAGVFLTQLSLDGKTLRGRRDEEGNRYHLLSLFCNRLSAVFGQLRSKVGGGEIAAAIDLLSSMDLDSKVISGDAMFSNEKLCQTIVNRGGDYVFTVKSNQQELRHELLQVFRLNPWPEMERNYREDVNKQHGRIGECQEDCVSS